MRIVPKKNWKEWHTSPFGVLKEKENKKKNLKSILRAIPILRLPKHSQRAYLSFSIVKSSYTHTHTQAARNNQILKVYLLFYHCPPCPPCITEFSRMHAQMQCNQISKMHIVLNRIDNRHSKTSIIPINVCSRFSTIPSHTHTATKWLGNDT